MGMHFASANGKCQCKLCSLKKMRPGSCEVIAKDMKNEKEKSDASVEVREDVIVDGTL